VYLSSCADWFAGLIPIYLAARYRPGGIYLGARCVLLIHNLAHQGVFAPGTFESLGLPGDWYRALEWQYPPDKRMGSYEEEGRAINTLKGAITTADRIVAVSPGAPSEGCLCLLFLRCQGQVQQPVLGRDTNHFGIFSSLFLA
jgi:starch synthase